MACWDERPGEQLRSPLLPGIAPSGRGPEMRGQRASVRSHELAGSEVARLIRFQDLEFAGSTKVVKYATFALLPLSDFPLRPLQRNSGGAVAPFRLPCS